MKSVFFYTKSAVIIQKFEGWPFDPNHLPTQFCRQTHAYIQWLDMDVVEDYHSLSTISGMRLGMSYECKVVWTKHNALSPERGESQTVDAYQNDYKATFFQVPMFLHLQCLMTFCFDLHHYFPNIPIPN